MPADTTTDTPEIVVRALTGSSTPTSSGPVVSVLTHPGYDLAADYVEPAGGDWVSEFPIRVRADGKGVVNWTHAIPVGLGAVEHKAIAGDTGELILATGLTDFFQSVGDLNGIDLTEYESPSSRTPIGRYTADECLRAAADAEALVRGGYATGVSIEFRPNGPKGSVEGEGAYWDREVKSPMLPRPGRHFKSWTGLAYAHARRPVNPGCHTVVNDIDMELVAKAIRVMETGKVGSHQLCDRVLKSFREDAPDLLALARAARRSTVTVEGVPPTDDVFVETKAEPGDRAEQIKQVEQRLEAANARLRTHESAEGGNWRRLKTINNHRRLIEGLTSHLAHLKGEGTATKSSLPVPKDLLHSPTAVELANSLGRQIRFNSEQIGTVIGLRRPSLRFPEGGVTVDVDGQDTSMDFRGLHDHIRAGTFRWHRPESDAVQPAETPKPEASADRLVFKNRGQRLKDLSDTPGVFEHVRGAIKAAHPAVDVSNVSIKKLPDRDSADHTVYFVADNQSFHGAGPSVEAATRHAVGKLTAAKQARADYLARQTPAEKEQAARDAAASAETSRAKWAETRAKFPGLFGQKAFGEDGELDDEIETKGIEDEPGLRSRINDPKHRDLTPQMVYADYLEDDEPHHATPEVLSALRGSTPVWVSRHPETGAVVTRPKRTWSLGEMQEAHRAAGGHFWDHDTVRYFGSRNHGDAHVGPGGAYFVNSTDNFDRTARQFRVVGWDENDHHTFSTDHPNHPVKYAFDNLADARAHAKRLAAGEIPHRDLKSFIDDTAVEVKAKSDAWIKWKVRKLVAEGKPRKQAVAVAYSMAGRGEKEAKATPDASELVSLVRGQWWRENGSATTRATRETMIRGTMEKHGVDREAAESAYKEAHQYATADYRKWCLANDREPPPEAKSYTGPLRASGRLNPNPNVEDEERGDDEPDFEIPGLDDEDDRDTKAVRTPRYDPTASQYAQTAHRLTGEALNLSRDVAPGMHKVATAALEASRLRDSATAITHLTKLADWHGKQARTAPPDTADLHAEAGMTARRALALHKMVADRGGVSGGAMQYTPDRTRPTKLSPSGFTPLPEFADRADTAHEVSRQVAGDSHRATRFAVMAKQAAIDGDLAKAGGAHLGAIREHEKELQKAGLSNYTRSRHKAAIQDHRRAAKKLHDHLISQGWVSPREQREAAAIAPATSTVRRPLYSGLEGLPYRPAVKPSAIDTATYEASNRQYTGPAEPSRRGIVGGLLKRLGITKAFEDSGVSDPYEVARIASGLAMKTGNDREAKATIARKSPAEMKAFHERAADNPRLDANAADRHLRAAEMWERAMVAPPTRLGNGRPYMKARTDGFDVPAVAMGPDEKPPASISALMNFAQLQMDGAEALAYDAQQSDDLMFRTYAKALATQAQTAAATLQKQASAMQQYLNGAANNGGIQKHPLMGVLSTDQNQPGTTTAGNVPPGADGTTADDADDVTANGAQKAFTDDAALDSLFAEPVAVPDNTPEVDADGWLVFKAFPEWKPRRYAMSELRDLPRANTGHANKSATANTTTAVQTPAAPTVEAKADEWASPEVAAKLGELTAQLKKLKQLDEAVQHRQQRGGW